MNDPFQPTLAIHRSAALELRLSRGDWKSVCLVLRDLFSWQDWALADIEARHDLHPNTQAAIHHAFRINRRALTSIRYAIENALNRKDCPRSHHRLIQRPASWYDIPGSLSCPIQSTIMGYPCWIILIQLNELWRKGTFYCRKELSLRMLRKSPFFPNTPRCPRNSNAHLVLRR